MINVKFSELEFLLAICTFVILRPIDTIYILSRVVPCGVEYPRPSSRHICGFCYTIFAPISFSFIVGRGKPPASRSIYPLSLSFFFPPLFRTLIYPIVMGCQLALPANVCRAISSYRCSRTQQAGMLNGRAQVGMTIGTGFPGEIETRTNLVRCFFVWRPWPEVRVGACWHDAMASPHHTTPTSQSKPHTGRTKPHIHTPATIAQFRAKQTEYSQSLIDQPPARQGGRGLAGW